MKENIINIIKKFDYIGKTFNFRYKSHENYRSFPGGIFFICFLLLSISYILLNLIYFLIRINKSIINYDTIISPTDKMNFINYSFSIGFSITCNHYNETNNYPLNDLFDMSFNFIQRQNNTSDKKIINMHLCNYSDFNKDIIDQSIIKKFTEHNIYYCPDNLDNIITGIYEDDYFTYYEFSITAKKLDNFTIYYDLLSNYDCKCHFLTSHLAFDLHNFTYPINNFISDYFLQINPLGYAKRNIFFKLTEFQSSKKSFSLDYKKKYYMDYSRYEDYLLFKPKERFDEKILDYEKFVTLYFRADNERTYISRKYKTFVEYSSEVFTALSIVYLIFFLFISMINNFYANHSIMQEFFQFKKTEKASQIFNKLKIRMNERKIQRLSKMSKIAEFGRFAPGELENHSIFVQIKAKNKRSSNNLTNNIRLSNIMSTTEGLNNKETFIEKKNCSNNKTVNNTSNNVDISPNNSTNKIFKESNNIVYLNNNSFHIYDSGKMNYKLSLFKGNESDKKNNINLKKGPNANFPFSKNDRAIKKMIKKLSLKEKKIDLHFSIMEIIISIFFPFCSNSNLETKNKLLEKAKYKLFYGLDILTYLRNLQRTEYLNFILLEPYQNVVLGYMTKPSISLDYQFDVFEHLKAKYNPDFNKCEVEEFLKCYNHLSKIKNKCSIDTRLFNIINIELENLCIE